MQAFSMHHNICAVERTVRPAVTAGLLEETLEMLSYTECTGAGLSLLYCCHREVSCLWALLGAHWLHVAALGEKSMPFRVLIFSGVAGQQLGSCDRILPSGQAACLLHVCRAYTLPCLVATVASGTLGIGASEAWQAVAAALSGLMVYILFTSGILLPWCF